MITKTSRVTRIQDNSGNNAFDGINRAIRYVVTDDEDGTIFFLDSGCSSRFQIRLGPYEMRHLASALFGAAKKVEARNGRSLRHAKGEKP